MCVFGGEGREGACDVWVKPFWLKVRCLKPFFLKPYCWGPGFLCSVKFQFKHIAADGKMARDKVPSGWLEVIRSGVVLPQLSTKKKWDAPTFQYVNGARI